MYRFGKALQRGARPVLLLLLVLVLLACGAPPQPPASGDGDAPAGGTAQGETTAGESDASLSQPSAAGSDPYTTVYGERLPDDAAPYTLQTYKVACNMTDTQSTFDFAVSVYHRICEWEGRLNDLFQDQLVTMDRDFQVIPAAAESWEVSDDGLTWTFHIKRGLVWSDGTPLTAHDWVATYRLMADPAHEWDFAWFYRGVLKHWDDVSAGLMPPEALGVVAVDDHTLQFTTQTPVAFFPAMMRNSFVLQQKALEEYGPYYNSSVETSVSAGPFVLREYEPGVRVVMEANPTYRGYRKPMLRQLIGEYRDMNTVFVTFQNHEIDYVKSEYVTLADYATIQGDEELRENYLRHHGDFRTDYLFFDTDNPPFDDLLVRQAFAHALDRRAIVDGVFGEARAMPAYGMLMPGFPAAHAVGELDQYQAYDCEQARQYLAEAGYPDGEGFPEVAMWMRNESPGMQEVYRAAAASIRQCLDIQIEATNVEYERFMDALNAQPTRLQFGAVSYGMDYLDPSSMLGVWLSSGRHTWELAQYDDLVHQANSISDDPDQRRALFQQAERLLVEQVGAVFLAHRWQGDLVQPYVQGDGFRGRDAQGMAGWHWGNDWAIGSIYIADTVREYDTYRDAPGPAR